MSAIATIPKASDRDVVMLLNLNCLTGAPTMVRYEERGYSARFCHVSAKHCAILHGGRRVHGWALWRRVVPGAPPGTTILLAEHHSVWETPGGELLDVTPRTFEDPDVLFLRDDSATIIAANGVFLLRTDLTDWPEIPRMLAGYQVDYKVFALEPTKPDLVEYVARLGFDLSRLATDAQG
jgi:hypothetical protein